MQHRSNKAAPSRQGKGHKSLSSPCWCMWSLWRLCNDCWWTLIYTTLMMCTKMHTSHFLSKHCSRVDGADLAGKKAPCAGGCHLPVLVSAAGTHVHPFGPCQQLWERKGENGRTNPISDPFSQKCTPDALKNDRLLVSGDCLNSNTWAEGYTRPYFCIGCISILSVAIPSMNKRPFLSLTSW